MFRKLFQRKPKPSTPERQLARVESLDGSSPQHLNQLLEIAKSDPDPAVRMAAAERIGLRDCLAALLADERDPEVRAMLVAKLFQACSDEDAVEMATSLLRHAEDDAARVALLQDIEHTAAATFVAARIQDPAVLLQAALEHKLARVRLSAAQQLDDEAQLRELSQRSRDKSVRQWVRGQLKARKAQRQQREQQRAELGRLHEQAEQLAQSENPVNYRGRLARLQQGLEPLAAQAEPAQREALAALFARCEDRAAAFETAAQRDETAHKPAETLAEAPGDASPGDASPGAENTPAAPEGKPGDVDASGAAPTGEPVGEPVADDPNAAARAALADQLETLLTQPQPAAADAIRAALQDAGTRWEALGEDAPAHPFHRHAQSLARGADSLDYLAANGDDLAALCETPLDPSADPQALGELLESLGEYLRVLHWPPAWQAPPVLQALRATELQAQDTRELQRRAARKQLQTLEKKVHRLGDALRRKNLRLASAIERELRDARDALPEPERRQLQSRLERHLPELKKLQDWHEYSAAPKKEALCEQMEALVERELAPEARAEAVKALRAQWRSVTAANVQRDDPLWERFNGAAERAYAPCEPYFEQQRARKRDNLAQRERLTAELEGFVAGVDWQQPPLAMLDKVLRAARAEWQQYSPVHFPDAKPCQRRFDKAMDKIHAALQQQRRGNAEARERLIERAEALAEAQDVEAAIAQALELQREWKAVGPVTPQQQRKQWNRFRQPMDALFARRQAARDANNAEIDQRRAAASALLDQLAAHADAADEQLPALAEQIEQLQGQIDAACAELPKKAQAALYKRQHALLNAIEAKRLALPRRRRARAYALLEELAQACGEAESTLLGGAQTEVEALRERIAASPWQSLLQARGDALLAPANWAGQLEDNREQLERLAIELEILADVDTPEAHRGQRRAWQLDMLEAGGGHDGVEDAEKLFQLLQRWHAVGAVQASERAALSARLAAVRAPFAELLDPGTQ